MVDAPAGPLAGGRFKPYIKAIVEAERAPIRQIEDRKAKEADRLKVLQEFTAKVRKLTDSMKEIGDFRKFRELKADLGKNDELIGVEVDGAGADPGEYQVEVTQLAGRHSMLSNGFETPDDEIGVGFFTYDTVGGESKSVYLDSDHNTLRTLVKAINDEKDLGLQALLVNDGTNNDAPWRIIVAGKKTGMNNDIIYPNFYFVDGDIQFSSDEERAAQSAIVKLNGFEILCDKNRISDLIPGLTIDLKQAREGYEFTLNVKEDIAKISGKIKASLDSINAVLEFINKQNQLDERSDTTRTLGGDSMLRSIETQLRELIVSPISIDEDGERSIRASDLGIQFERTGLLSFKADKFQKMLADDFGDIARYFTSQGGFTDRIQRITSNLVNPSNGLLVERERGFRERTKKMDDDIARKETQISRKEETLKRQFANLEATITNLQNQQQYMSNALASSGGPAG